MCYSQYPSEGLDLLNKIKNIEVYMGNDNTKALSGMDMTTGSIPVKILKFSIPLMLAQILEVLFNMSDVAVVGKFSSYEALGAVGSTSLLVTLFTGFLIGMGCGVNVRVAQQLGAEIITTHGEDVPTQIAEYARLSDVTKIVIGRSGVQRRHFWSEPTLTEQLITLAPEMDIHIIPDAEVYKSDPRKPFSAVRPALPLSLIHISEPTRH